MNSTGLNIQACLIDLFQKRVISWVLYMNSTGFEHSSLSYRLTWITPRVTRFRCPTYYLHTVGNEGVYYVRLVLRDYCPVTILDICLTVFSLKDDTSWKKTVFNKPQRESQMFKISALSLQDFVRYFRNISKTLKTK